MTVRVRSIFISPGCKRNEFRHHHPLIETATHYAILQVGECTAEGQDSSTGLARCLDYHMLVRGTVS